MMDTWYGYNYWNILGFISTEWDGITVPSEPYLYRYTDHFFLCLNYTCFISLYNFQVV